MIQSRLNGPYAAASFAPIVEADISAVAAQAFLTDDLVGHKVALTGPQAFSNDELVTIDRRHGPGSDAAVPGRTPGPTSFARWVSNHRAVFTKEEGRQHVSDTPA